MACFHSHHLNCMGNADMVVLYDEFKGEKTSTEPGIKLFSNFQVGS